MLRNSPSAKSVIPNARAFRFGIVVSRYNEKLTGALLDATLQTLKKAGAKSVRHVTVPGAYEIPVVAMRWAKTKKFDAIIALGVVFAGKTTHAEHITLAAAINLQSIAIQTGVPVIHQILTPKNSADAKARVHLRGVEAATTAIEMAGLMKGL